MRRFKKQYKLNKIKRNLSSSKKNRKINNKLFPILIATLIISVTCSATQAYFNSKLDLTSMLNGGGRSNLSIENGQIKLNFGAMPTEWNISDTNLKKTVTDSEMIVNDPSKDSSVTYEGVTLTSNTNLTTNVDLSMDYSIKKIGGSKEDSQGTSEAKTLQGFEVIVGDIDNLNYGWTGTTKKDSYYSGTYDVYSGELYNRNDAFTNINGVHDRGLRPLPKGYDAPGTDRRMVISSFYDFFNGRLNGALGTKNVNAEWNKLGTVNYTTGNNQWGNGYDYKLEKYNKIWIGSDNRNYYYDGYTNRTLRGEWGSDGQQGQENDAKYDGLNWKYTQKVQPITFKYGEISNDEAINSVCFQIFVDDLQAGNEIVTDSYFPHDSIASYKAYLKVAGESDDKKIQVNSWSNILNAVNQEVPAGNIVTLSLPMNDGNYDEYISMIRRASGLNKGLQLIIDDPNNIAGDSYCIDFAKMTVNAEASIPDSQLITASGIVYDSDMKPLKGATVVSGDGRSAVTDENGKFSFKVAKGFLNIKASKLGKKDDYFISSSSITSNITDITLRLADDPSYNAGTIKAQNKIGIQMIVDQYRDENATDADLNSVSMDVPKQADSKSEIVKVNGKNIIRTTINYNDIKSTKVSATQALCSLGVKPGYEYKIKYVLSLKTAQEIGDLAGFKLEFTSNLKAKATQENNPGWSVLGTGSKYSSTYTAQKIEEGGSQDTPDTTKDNVFNNKTPEIYFETPVRNADDTCGKDFWTNSPPTIKIGTASSAPAQANITNKLSGVKLVDNTNIWYKVNSSTGNSINKNSIIKVESANNQTSGNLYYFSTNKIFICTNGYIPSDSTLTIKYVDEAGKEIATSNTISGKSGTEINVTAKEIAGYRLIDPSTSPYKGTLREGNNVIEFKYKKAKAVAVELVNESGNIINAEKVFNSNGDELTSYTKSDKDNMYYKYGIDGEKYSVLTNDFKQVKDKSNNYYQIKDTQTNYIDKEYSEIPVGSMMKYTYQYNKCNVTINYIDEDGKELANSEHRYIKDGTYNVNEADIAVSNSAKDKLTKYEYVKATIGNNSEPVSTVTIDDTDIILNYVYKSSGVIVHYYNSLSWDNCYIYAYGSDGDYTNSWPGTLMTKESSSNWWTYKINKKEAKIIINNNNKQKEYNSTFISGEIWIKGDFVYRENPDNISDDTKVIVHYYNESWNPPYIHAYSDTDGNYTGAWPGKAMEKDSSDNWWTYTITGKNVRIIISNNGSNQKNYNSECAKGEVWLY